MITAGVDVGSLSTNVVIWGEEGMIATHTIRTGFDSSETSWRVMAETLEMAKGNLKLQDIDCIVATGYGRFVVPFSHYIVNELSCHLRGNSWFFPEVHTVLDMGGQDCKVIRCDARGNMVMFALNDKCAAGTGRYLERTSRTLGVTLEEFGPLSLQRVNGAATISNVCAVFAQQDITRLIQQGVHRNDILAGACEAIVKRIYPLFQQVGGIEEAFVISGGVAKNIGVVKSLENRFGIKAHIAPDPQIVGALGAAILAREKKIQKEESNA